MANEHEKRGEEPGGRPAKDAKKKDKVLEADEQSFPASDAPAWTQSAAGRPHYEPGKDAKDKDARKEPPRE